MYISRKKYFRAFPPFQKKILTLILSLILVGFKINSLFAARIDAKAPVVNITINPTLQTSDIIAYTALTFLGSAVQNEFNQTIASEFQKALIDANNTVGKYTLDKLGLGFANANSYATNVNNMQGYQNYDLFSVSAGGMLGVQLPSKDPNYYSEIDKKIETDGDLYAGLAPGISIINIGIRPGWFGLSGNLVGPINLEDLYFNVNFGSYSMNQDIGSNGKLEFDSTHFGLGIRWALFKSHGFGWGLIKWRGLSVGSGFAVQKNNLKLTMELEKPQPTPVSFSPSGYNAAQLSGTLSILPDPATFSMNFTTYTIPVDIVTSVQLLYLLNFSLGAGFDINFGSADLSLKASGSSSFTQTGGTEYFSIQMTPATASVSQSATNKPSLLRGRLMAGIGLQIGPVKVDVPFIYYLNSGFAVGLSAGIVW